MFIPINIHIFKETIAICIILILNQTYLRIYGNQIKYK